MTWKEWLLVAAWVVSHLGAVYWWRRAVKAERERDRWQSMARKLSVAASDRAPMLPPPPRALN